MFQEGAESLLFFIYHLALLIHRYFASLETEPDAVGPL